VSQNRPPKKLGVKLNSHFQAGWASQPMGYLWLYPIYTDWSQTDACWEDLWGKVSSSSSPWQQD